MKKKKFKILLPIIVILGIIFGAYNFYQYQENKDQITLYGNVDIKEVSASFRVSGRLKKLFFDEGDLVKEGEVLATLEDDTFINNLELAKANLQSIQANLENAKRKFLRSKKLFKQKSISKQEYENDKFNFEQLSAQIAAQKVQVKIAQTALNDTNLYAPTDAFVMTRAFESGSMLAANQTVYELSLTNQAFVIAYIDEKDLGKIANGTTVEIITDSNSKYEGKIGYISPKAEFTPKTVETTSLRTELVYRLRISIKSPDQKLKQGMPVTAIIKL
ncbi:MAG: efflux RND transporter periplasmic adaptor subunit, partial [Rickettsiales bacterium]|nr:efflux RND transporter periplasmic adaptor subunit [Rickettsiales bacterium]